MLITFILTLDLDAEARCVGLHWDEPISGQPLSFIPLNHLSFRRFTFTGSSRLRTSFKGEILPRNWLGWACTLKDSLLADSTSLAELSYFVKLSPFKKCNLAWLFWLPSHSLTSGLPSTCCRRSTLERPMQISIRLTESATGRWLVQVLSLIILHWSLSIAFAEKKNL